MRQASEGAASPPGITRWDGCSADTLRAALASPTTCCLENVLPCENDDASPRPGDRLRLVVTTRSAYRYPVAKILTEELHARTPLSDDLRIRIISAVQEALMNAVLHGNLRIASGRRRSLAGLEAVHDEVEASLARPEVADAGISIQMIWDDSTLELTVKDGGRGYSDVDSHDEPEAAAFGRGLAILRAFSDKVNVLDGGTTLKLEFRL